MSCKLPGILLFLVFTTGTRVEELAWHTICLELVSRSSKNEIQCMIFPYCGRALKSL